MVRGRGGKGRAEGWPGAPLSQGRPRGRAQVGGLREGRGGEGGRREGREGEKREDDGRG